MNPDNDIKIRIKAFRAVDDIQSCQMFAEGHRKILQIYGVTQVTSANLDWMENPFVYVIMAESMTESKALGGARVHVHDPGYPLPIEYAVEEIDSGIHALVEKYSLAKTGELCGLWNSKEVAGMGIATQYLMRAGISIVTQLNLGSLFALCAEHTLQISTSKGFVIETSLGNKGTFYYPKQDLVATSLIIEDLHLLTNADKEERDAIFSLRENPTMLSLENSTRGSFHIQYDLLIGSTLKSH